MTSSSNPPSVTVPLENLKKPEFFRQEFRMGLVVYGGVSLAIYMNGVCREFYNAVRGRGIYKLIKALTDSDIVVDIISGTSAGGINGVLLSYALTNSDEKTAVDFENFAGIWRESGDINQLLRNPTEQKDQATNSVLDGEGYYQRQLAGAFENASKKAISAPNNGDSFKDEWFSDSEELDLFVTGTDVLGKVYQAWDNTGRTIEVKDHRSVFLLKHRRGRKHPFEPSKETYSSLATLCRITSCFPVAFPVVSVTLSQSKKDNSSALIKSVNENLELWGQLADRELPKVEPKDGYQLHFVDGGVLDNRPFSYTIEQIYRRTAYRPVERKLFYIDPSPDRFLGSPKFDLMTKPSIWESALDSLVSMPRYESIANDLKEINARNEKVRRYKFLRNNAERLAVQEVQHDRTLDAQAESNRAEQLYLRCRLEGLRDRVMPLILGMDRANAPSQTNQALLASAAQLVTKYISDKKSQEEQGALLQELGIEIRNLDVDYALRKHFFLLEKICEFMSIPTNYDWHQDLEKLARTVCLQVELLEVIQAALEDMLRSLYVSQTFCILLNQTKEEGASIREDIRPRIYDYLLRLHRFLLDADGLILDPNDLSNVLSQLKQRNELLSPAKLGLKAKVGENSQEELELDFEQETSIWKDNKYTFVKKSENDTSIYFSILRKVELETENLISHCSVDPARDLLIEIFRNFRNIDEEVYSYEYLSDIQAKEQIEIFRISPQDAQLGFSDRKAEEKLAGAQLGAFGGFFKKSWRSNDILWGRLDGLNRIVEALLTPESLQNFSYFLDRQVGKELQARETYIDRLIEEAFPAVTPEKDPIKAALMKLAKGERLAGTDLTKFHAQIVTAAHRGILQSDLKNVLEDALAGQITWGQQILPPDSGKPEDKSAPKFEAIGGYLDKAITPFAVSQLVQDSIKETLTSPDETERYFRDRYQVGSEKVTQDIPPIILEDLAARTGLVLRNILQSPPSGKYLNKLNTFKVVSFLLETFNLWVHAQNPKTSFIPVSLRSRLSLLVLIVAIAGIAFVVSNLPVPLLILIVTLAILQFPYRLITRFKRSK